MHPLFVLLYMREEKSKSFEYKVSVTPPRSLFSRIIKRLGLEKQLRVVKRHLGFSTVILAFFIILSVFTVIGLKHELAESNFGPLISLVFSDPDAVLKYWHSFILSFFESAPTIAIFTFLFTLALITFFIRYVIVYLEKFLLLLKSIRKPSKKYVR